MKSLNLNKFNIKEIIKNKDNFKIKLIGDSITHGVGGSGWEQNGDQIVQGWNRSPKSYCWANLFRDYMRDKYRVAVINNGCTGTNIEFVIDNFSNLVDDSDDIIICTIGTNNRHKHFWEGPKPEKEIHFNNFYQNAKKLYSLFLEANKPVIFVANIPTSAADEKDGNDYWRIIQMADINIAYKNLANEYGASVISLHDLIIEYCNNRAIAIDLLLSDGLHPNDEGYKVMFDLLVEALGL